MNIALLAAGAGGMICGSCLRDNALARALRNAGHAVTLVPLYTPLRVEGESVGLDTVFYGGVNTYLQYASAIFRHTPRALDWLLDRPALLTWAGSKGATTSPANVAGLTAAILQGDHGPTAKELRRLVRFLKTDVRPDVVTLPNLMFLGAAPLLRDELRVPIVCELTGEDIFLEATRPDDQQRLQALIRQHAAAIARFVATSHYYARKMATYLAIDSSRIAVVYPGVPTPFSAAPRGRAPTPVPTVGYLARICPEKGLDRLLDALPHLLQRTSATIRAAGYLSPAHRPWLDQLLARLRSDHLLDHFHYAGELTGPQKHDFLDAINVLSVPTAHPEPKGIYVLESLAAGKPVVLPNHGAFPELIELTGGGSLVAPNDPHALATALADLLTDPPRRAALGDQGRRAVAASFTESHMAAKMLQVFNAARDQ